MDYEKIDKLLKEKGIMQKELCQNINITTQHYHGLKKGDRNISFELVLRICEFLQINPMDIAPEYKNYYDIILSNVKLNNNLENNEKDMIIINKNLSNSQNELSISLRNSTETVNDLTKHIINVSTKLLNKSNKSDEVT